MTDIFDKVKQGITKGVATVSVKSKEMLDTTKLKSQIDTLGNKKKDALEELGNIVYTLYLKGTPDEERVKSRCDAIAALDNQMKEIKEELRLIRLQADEALGKPRPVTICSCGNDIYEGTKFCGKCGKKVDLIEEKDTSGRICPTCNAPLLQDAKFCGECGNKVEQI
ncbi:zinc ribbon domain-containing protein [Syntrophorhabdus aromaticivorans]|uniref:zinc ribbon domain-containing protein n=1 Tax=Syntrophorhabdus aromaticivorans TaxID=328301 RepID=UPI000428D72E|nr:zinc ribbon domain-containing protein [Syntrophorhabdus aromaticivorans]